MDVVKSKNNISIRLTKERWFHIIENHDDLAGYYNEVLQTIEEPDYIIRGYRNALIALREIGKGKFLAVIYKELETDSFIITVHFTREVKLKKEIILWEGKS